LDHLLNNLNIRLQRALNFQYVCLSCYRATYFNAPESANPIVNKDVAELQVLISMMEDLKMGRPVAALQAPEPRSSNTGMREATSPGYAVGGYKAGAVASPGTALAPQLQGSGVPSFGPPCFGGVSQPGYGSVVMPMHGGVYQHGHVGNSGPADGMAMPGGVYQQQSMPQQMGGQYGMPPANAGYTVGGAAFL
jgi:hypothetical protein